MILLRSILFNIAFYANLLCLVVFGIPILFMRREQVFWLARQWGRNSLWLLDTICRLKVEYRGVGNIPPGDREPGILACSPNPPAGSKPCQFDFAFDPQNENVRDASFNAAIARVATANGATLVDLHAAFLAARARGEEDAFWVGNDFSPNEKGHAFIARQFAPAVRAALKSRG